MSDQEILNRLIAKKDSTNAKELTPRSVEHITGLIGFVVMAVCVGAAIHGVWWMVDYGMELNAGVKEPTVNIGFIVVSLIPAGVIASILYVTELNKRCIHTSYILGTLNFVAGVVGFMMIAVVIANLFVWSFSWSVIFCGFLIPWAAGVLMFTNDRHRENAAQKTV